MLYDTTVLSASTTTLDYLDIDSDFASTVTTTIATSLTAAPPLNIHHYYHYGSSYVASLSDEELSRISSLISNKTVNEEKPKQLR